MPKYKCNLQDYIDQSNKIDIDFIFKTGSRLLDAFELVHECGFTYNDLKPQNVMVHIKDGNTPSPILIDFGLVKKYLKSNGSHNPSDLQTDNFEGNLMFSSQNQMNFFATSRKDDLISLTYMMFFLMNENKLPLQDDKFFEKLEKLDGDS